MKNLMRLAVVVVVLLSVQGCHTMTFVDVADKNDFVERAKPSSVVNITTRTGDKHQINVTYNDGETIKGIVSRGKDKGKEQQYALTEIALIKVREFDDERAARLAFEALIHAIVMIASGGR
jgi:hypothetical protein